MTDSQDSSKFRRRLEASSLGLEMGGAVAVGYFAGDWVDRRFGTEPWGLVFFLTAGFGAAVKALLRVVRRTKEDLARKPGDSS